MYKVLASIPVEREKEERGRKKGRKENGEGREEEMGSREAGRGRKEEHPWAFRFVFKDI